MIRDGADPAAIAAAAREIAAGGLVAFPTETVYGLGARADDEQASAGIFAAKGRPTGHPLIVHVADVHGARAFCAEWPALAERLAAAFWPGPLTLIVPRRPGIATAAAAGQPTVGLRCPAHPVAQALLDAAQRLGVAGIAGPSANRFGRVSPTTAQHVAEEFGASLTVLDGGACPVGIESAIVDCSGERPRLLRPGGLSRARLEALLGAPVADRDAGAPRAPGSLASHYAPNARTVLFAPGALHEALQAVYTAGTTVAIYSRSEPPRLPPGAFWRGMPGDAEAAARELFATLRELDATGASLILIEQPPEEPAWEAVRDRLTRAAA